jgi:hypothetical protein
LYISSIVEKNQDNENLFTCRIKNVNNNKVKEKEVFFKLAPLLDPYKFLIGKYNFEDENLFNLPKIDSSISNINSKLLDMNNSAYVDGFFLFLTSNLIDRHNFIHGVDYYGSFLAIKNNFLLNIFDDIDYLNNSDFFNKNKNVLFTVDTYDHLFQEEKPKLKTLLIDNKSTTNSRISLKSINSDIFEDIFEDDIENNTIDLNELKDLSLELVDITNYNLECIKDDNKVSLKSNSTCSSRSSHTSCEEVNDENCDECGNNIEYNSKKLLHENENDYNILKYL